MIMAPKGSCLVSFDLSQAESWIVAFLANERRMKQSLLFGDIHSDTSCGIFYPKNAECLHLWQKEKATGSRICSNCGVTITDTERYLGKKNNHANSYGQSEGMLVTSINKESDKPPYITVGLSDVKPMFKAWHNYINLSGWWESIQRELGPRRQLTTPYDFTRTFYGYWGKELFKEAYAFKPQSTIADHVFGAIHKDLGIPGGLLEIHRKFVATKYCKIINTAHDSFVLEYPSETVPNDFIAEVARCFRRPLVVRDEEFTIPCDAKWGLRYDEGMQEIDINALIGPANPNRTIHGL
jgi:hypothetical protein